MEIIGIIPARWGSTRFPGKVLARIHGKPMIQHVWERARRCSSLNHIYIACDDERVRRTAEDFGAIALMTSPDCGSGTDRIAQAVHDLQADIVVNVQGDEPLIDPRTIDKVARALVEHQDFRVATAIKRIVETSDIENPNVVKVVIDQNYRALYFSRSVIPYNRERKPYAEGIYYKHLGIYAYRRDFLLAYHDLPFSRLEQAEKLEQLRFLEAGESIKTVETEFDTIGVDTPQDLERVIPFIKSSEK